MYLLNDERTDSKKGLSERNIKKGFVTRLTIKKSEKPIMTLAENLVIVLIFLYGDIFTRS